MELLGPSLSTLFKQMGSKFTLPTVLKLTDQIVSLVPPLKVDLAATHGKHAQRGVHSSGYQAE